MHLRNCVIRIRMTNVYLGSIFQSCLQLAPFQEPRVAPGSFLPPRARGHVAPRDVTRSPAQRPCGCPRFISPRPLLRAEELSLVRNLISVAENPRERSSPGPGGITPLRLAEAAAQPRPRPPHLSADARCWPGEPEPGRTPRAPQPPCSSLRAAGLFPAGLIAT